MKRVALDENRVDVLTPKNPEEPVTAMMGCFADMVASREVGIRIG